MKAVKGKRHGRDDLLRVVKVANGRYLRARFVPNLEGTSPSGLFTTFASGQSLSDNRVTVARFKHIGGNVDVDDNEYI